MNDLNCIELVELVTDYLEGALPASERERFEQHVASCPGCTAYLDQMRTTIALTGGLAGDDLPAEARDGLLAAFRGWKSGA